jgi:redox-regulated HSP33 family molecular chaperone
MSAGVQFLLGREQSYWNGVLVQAQARKAETESVLAIVQLEIGKATLVTTQHQAKAAEGQVALLKMQLASEDAKYCLTSEQVESKRADTSNTRTDGTPIVGTAGKQKELYTQQIDSYQKDSSFKIAKLFSDSWTVQKTLNENLEAPDNFLNAEVDKVMNSIREGSGLGTPAP